MFSARAAGELRLWLADLLGEEVARAIRAATFSLGVCQPAARARERVRPPERYTIYDQGDMRRVLDWLLSDAERGQIQSALREHGQPASAEVLAEISWAKNLLLTPESYERSAAYPAGALVAAGIGAYLYTALQPVVLPIGPDARQVQVQARPAGDDLLLLSPATEAWPRERCARQMSADAVRHDLGEILSHGEPAAGTGQGEAAEEPHQSPAEAFWNGEPGPARVNSATRRAHEASQISPGENSSEGNGVVHVEFGGHGPDAA